MHRYIPYKFAAQRVRIALGAKVCGIECSRVLETHAPGLLGPCMNALWALLGEPDLLDLWP